MSIENPTHAHLGDPANVVRTHWAIVEDHEGGLPTMDRVNTYADGSQKRLPIEDLTVGDQFFFESILKGKVQ